MVCVADLIVEPATFADALNDKVIVLQGLHESERLRALSDIGDKFSRRRFYIVFPAVIVLIIFHLYDRKTQK